MPDRHERFAIRTVIFKISQARPDKDSNVWFMDQTVRTVVVTGRLAAATAAEKIGKFSEKSWERMKRFLEGGPISKSGNVTFETDKAVYAGRSQANLAMILAIDEG